MRPSAESPYGPAAAVLLAVLVSACAGGLVGSKEKKVAYFNNLERDTLARLIKEQPKVKKSWTNRLVMRLRRKKASRSHSSEPVAVLQSWSRRLIRNGVTCGSREYSSEWVGGGTSRPDCADLPDVDKLRELADGKWHAGAGAEAAAKAGDVGASGSGSTADLVKKGYSSYVLTDAGVSATATIAVLRAQPYSIE